MAIVCLCLPAVAGNKELHEYTNPCPLIVDFSPNLTSKIHGPKDPEDNFQRARLILNGAT